MNDDDTIVRFRRVLDCLCEHLLDNAADPELVAGKASEVRAALDSNDEQRAEQLLNELALLPTDSLTRDFRRAVRSILDEIN